MGRTLKFEVVGEPQSWKRAGHFVMNGHVKTFTPAAMRSYQSLIAMSAREAQIREGMNPETFIFKGAIRVVVTAYFPVAESRRKGKHALFEGQPHTQKPDADNILKNVCDALSSVAWHDDCSVYEKLVTKRWTYQAPRCVVEVEEV